MDYRFTAILILLLCLLAFFVKPAQHTPLKIESKDYILPKPKPIDPEAEWNAISDIDIDSLSPLEALTKLNELKKKIKF